jgi:hypothetical protein
MVMTPGRDLRLEVMHFLDCSMDWSLTARCLACGLLGLLGINLQHLGDEGFGFFTGQVRHFISLHTATNLWTA